MKLMEQVAWWQLIGAALLLGTPALGAGTPSKALPLLCGDVVDADITLQADLVCPGFTGKVLTVKGSRHVLNGNGHRIVAPDAQIGVSIEGPWNEVRDLEISGLNHGVAISAIDAPYLEIRGSILNDNQVGIQLDATRTEMHGVWIHENQIRSSARFGVLAQQRAKGHILLPQFWHNDLSRSLHQAFHLEVSSAQLNSRDRNVTEGWGEPNWVALTGQ